MPMSRPGLQERITFAKLVAGFVVFQMMLGVNLVLFFLRFFLYFWPHDLYKFLFFLTQLLEGKSYCS